MWKWLEGKKTYIVAGVMVATGIGGAYFGALTSEAAMQLVLTGLGFAGLRNGFTSALAQRAVEAAAKK